MAFSVLQFVIMLENDNAIVLIFHIKNPFIRESNSEVAQSEEELWL